MDKDTLFSSFGKWISPIITKSFKDSIAENGQDKYVKKLMAQSTVVETVWAEAHETTTQQEVGWKKT